MSKDAIMRIISAWRISHATEEKFMEMGFAEGPVSDISGNIFDAIYAMLGECTDTYEGSFTYDVLMDESLTPDQCADKIISKYYETADALPCEKHISDCILDCIRDESNRLRIGTGALIRTILGEWALRKERLSH